GFTHPKVVNPLREMFGLAMRPTELRHDTELLVPQFGTQGDAHAHLNNLSRQFGAEIARFGTERDTTTD
ncbi:hypothetical protein C0993_007054, partial [Termitomyces sp. T159_Od127]